MRETKAVKAERDEAIAKLRELIKPGDTLYTLVTHVARSGMSRSIRVFIMGAAPWDISHYVARVLRERMDDKNGGIKIGGCGMDMGFHIVYNLGRYLFPEGGSLDATNGVRRGQFEREGGTKETDGGYLIKQRWL